MNEARKAEMDELIEFSEALKARDRELQSNNMFTSKENEKLKRKKKKLLKKIDENERLFSEMDQLRADN